MRRKKNDHTASVYLETLSTDRSGFLTSPEREGEREAKKKYSY